MTKFRVVFELSFPFWVNYPFKSRKVGRLSEVFSIPVSFFAAPLCVPVSQGAACEFQWELSGRDAVT